MPISLLIQIEFDLEFFLLKNQLSFSHKKSFRKSFHGKEYGDLLKMCSYIALFTTLLEKGLLPVRLAYVGECMRRDRKGFQKNAASNIQDKPFSNILPKSVFLGKIFQ